jgi:hypothetical protein
MLLQSAGTTQSAARFKSATLSKNCIPDLRDLIIIITT